MIKSEKNKKWTSIEMRSRPCEDGLVAPCKLGFSINFDWAGDVPGLCNASGL